jgi:hypothetical protein
MVAPKERMGRIYIYIYIYIYVCVCMEGGRRKKHYPFLEESKDALFERQLGVGCAHCRV